MKKVFGILLLCCLAIPFLGVYSWLYVEKHQIKKESEKRVVAGITKSELVLLKFTIQESENKLHWEHDREFEYNGQMYDVVEKTIRNDSVWYWCWWDRAETHLNKQLQNLFAPAGENDREHREKEGQFVQFFKTLYFTGVFSWSLHPEKKGNVQPTRGCLLYYSINRSPATPPPEIAGTIHHDRFAPAFA